MHLLLFPNPQSHTIRNNSRCSSAYVHTRPLHTRAHLRALVSVTLPAPAQCRLPARRPLSCPTPRALRCLALAPTDPILMQYCSAVILDANRSVQTRIESVAYHACSPAQTYASNPKVLQRRKEAAVGRRRCQAIVLRHSTR